MLKPFLLLLMLSVLTPSSLADTDLAISASVDPSLIAVNGTSYLYVDVSNYGADPALDVVVSSTLAVGLGLVSASTTQGSCIETNPVTCNLGTINAGNLGVQATVSFEVTASTVATTSNDFTSTTSSVDSNTTNNNANAMIEVVALADSADQSVTYDTMPDWTYQGVNTLFPIIVTNNGPATVTQSSLTFSIPLLTLSDFISVMPDQGNCTTALDSCVGLGCVAALAVPLSVSCDLGGISSGSSVSVGITATMVGDVGDTFQLTATVDSDTTADADPANNQATVSVNLVAVPDVEGGAGPGGCFIATAAYGSDMAKEVLALRQFRDQYLLKYSAGQKFVALYYRYSPPLANYISGHESLRAVIRGIISVVVAVIQYPLVFMFAGLFSAITVGWRYTIKQPGALPESDP
ncbi:MAG: hypothetical protein AMJ55_05300 [Gammaproteobacteria bacterium SG8_15]|nr:MAG: hypothetical protein AMJ55_05300 [Gammaproteobacteria bacterium SG8_15]